MARVTFKHTVFSLCKFACAETATWELQKSDLTVQSSDIDVLLATDIQRTYQF